MKLISSTFLLLFTFVLTTAVSARAQSEVVPIDDALNAIQVLLSLSDKTKLPECSGLVTSKRLRFCPLISKCPDEKPFCVVKVVFTNNNSRGRKSCACSNTMAPIEITPVTTGVVKGTITWINTCGGAQYVGETCTRPYAGDYQVFSGTKEVFANSTNSDGKFSKSLEQGKYTLRVLTPTLERQSNSVEFSVVNGKTTEVELTLDTGIRGPILPQ